MLQFVRDKKTQPWHATFELGGTHTVCGVPPSKKLWFFRTDRPAEDDRVCQNCQKQYEFPTC